MIGRVIETGTVILADLGITSMSTAAMMKLIPETAKAAEKACCFLGAAAINGVACEYANDYIHKYFGNCRAIINGVKEGVKLANEIKNNSNTKDNTEEVNEENAVTVNFEEVKREIEEAKKNDPMKAEVEKLKKKAEKRVKGE